MKKKTKLYIAFWSVLTITNFLLYTVLQADYKTIFTALVGFSIATILSLKASGEKEKEE